MRIQLIGRRVDCIWLISRPFIGRVGPSMHAVAADHELYLRVEEFALHGDSLHFEIRRGATSLSPLVIEFVGEQTRSHLSKILPTNGFISSLSVNDSMGHNNMAAAFYIRLRGHIINNKGLSIVFSHFYRWATALCPGVREFHCDNARCIKSSLRCDGVDHCGDQSEEVACRDAASAMSNVELFNLPSLLTIAVAIVSAALVFALLSILISVARNRILFCLSGRSFFPNNSIHNRNVSSGGSSIEDRCHNGRNRNYTYSNNININDENEEPNVMTTQFSQHSSVTAYQNHMGNGRPPGSTPLRNTPNSEMFFASRMPLIQTIGNRRFYIFPPNNQLNVIEAPPTYDDALKHCAIMNTNIAQNNHTNRLCDQNVTNIDNNYDRYNDNTEEILNNIINNTSNADNCISNVTNECEIRIPTGRQRSSSYNFLSQSLLISHHQRSLSS